MFPPSLDVTPSTIEVYDGPIGSTSFGQIVARSRPCILRNALPTLAASQWTAQSLKREMRDRKVDVAMTPNGRADAIVDDKYFVEPYTTSVPFSAFMDALQNTALIPNHSSQHPILYLQSQNDNLRLPPTPTNDLSPLYPYVQEPSFASEFFAQPPEAVNIWIGDERSVTSLHRDSSYSNLYTVIRGSKKFTIFAPIEEPLLYERECLHATYKLRGAEDSAGSANGLLPSSSDLEFQSTDPPVRVPWASVNPLSPVDENPHPLFRYARPLVAQLGRGDTLYMPPGWYHAVEQKSHFPEQPPMGDQIHDEGEDTWQPCIAVNWWYDREIGMEWAVQGLIGRLSEALHSKP